MFSSIITIPPVNVSADDWTYISDVCNNRHVVFALKDMKRGKASDEDVKLVYECFGRCRKELVYLFSQCIHQERLLESYHIVMVILLHKETKKELYNYHFLSLLPNICKLFTKVPTKRFVVTTSGRMQKLKDGRERREEKRGEKTKKKDRWGKTHNKIRMGSKTW